LRRWSNEPRNGKKVLPLPFGAQQVADAARALQEQHHFDCEKPRTAATKERMSSTMNSPLYHGRTVPGCASNTASQTVDFKTPPSSGYTQVFYVTFSEPVGRVVSRQPQFDHAVMALKGQDGQPRCRPHLARVFRRGSRRGSDTRIAGRLNDSLTDALLQEIRVRRFRYKRF
jgi:hypothetical protein